MAKGGFRRLLKVENDLVVDHRPPGHPDAKEGTWIEVEVPKEVPATLNEMICAQAIKFINDKIIWPKALVKPKFDKFTETDVLLHALKKKLSKQELEEAREELRAKWAAVIR